MSLRVWDQQPPGYGHGRAAVEQGHSSFSCMVIFRQGSSVLSWGHHTSALHLCREVAYAEACASSSFFRPPKYFPVVLTAGTFQGDRDNSAGCETNPPKPKATTMKTIDKRDRWERRKGISAFCQRKALPVRSSLLQPLAHQLFHAPADCSWTPSIFVAFLHLSIVEPNTPLQWISFFSSSSTWFGCSCLVWLLVPAVQRPPCPVGPSPLHQPALYPVGAKCLLWGLVAVPSCWGSCALLAAENKCTCEIRVQLGSMGMLFVIVRWCSLCWEVQPGWVWLYFCSTKSCKLQPEPSGIA